MYDTLQHLQSTSTICFVLGCYSPTVHCSQRAHHEQRAQVEQPGCRGRKRSPHRRPLPACCPQSLLLRLLRLRPGCCPLLPVLLLLRRLLLLLALRSLLLVGLSLDGAQKVQHPEAAGRQPKLCGRDRGEKCCHSVSLQFATGCSAAYGCAPKLHGDAGCSWHTSKCRAGAECWHNSSSPAHLAGVQLARHERVHAKGGPTTMQVASQQPTWLVSSWPVMSACENRSSWWRNCGVDTSSRMAAALLQPTGHKHTFSEQ